MVKQENMSVLFDIAGNNSGAVKTKGDIPGQSGKYSPSVDV